MGTGVWRPLKLGIKVESLGYVHFTIEYLRNPSVHRLGKSLPIIGAGNAVICESVIVAISQELRSVIMSSTHGIQVKENGLGATDESGRTSYEGIFASGDVVTGAKQLLKSPRFHTA